MGNLNSIRELKRWIPSKHLFPQDLHRREKPSPGLDFSIFKDSILLFPLILD